MTACACTRREVNFSRAVYEMRVDRQTHLPLTDMVITILCTRPGDEVRP